MAPETLADLKTEDVKPETFQLMNRILCREIKMLTDKRKEADLVI